MKTTPIALLAAAAAMGTFATVARAQNDAQAADAGAPAPTVTTAPTTTPPPATTATVAATPPSTITMTREELEKLIDARIAAKAPPPTPTVGEGQKEVETPWAFGDFSWTPGGYAPSEHPLQAGPFTGEFRVDTVYHYSFANPKDNTIGGSSEVFRSNEVQVTQLGFGGDFLYKNVMARLMTQFGMYSTTTPRNDPSPAKGQWDLSDAYRYISEAYVGYHIPVMNGINVQAGIFMSYVGLWSYYNFDNWTYQPSYVSSNTPWFFDGVRVQIFPNKYLKIEPWIVNGWQSYGKFNEAPGVGLQIRWNPTEWFSVLGNQYFGTDTLGVPDRKRIHTDDSVMVRWWHKPKSAFSQAAASLTLDAGCEFGDGNAAAGIGTTTCGNQYFLGFMSYLRFWFLENHIGATVGGGAITNPGRYLVLVPPINGATAYSGVSATLPDGSPAFTANVGDQFQAWDMQLTGDWMPNPFITFRVEFNHRAASIPYFTGAGGITPCVNGICANNGAPGSWPAAGTPGLNNAAPDLSYTENRLTLAMMMRF